MKKSFNWSHCFKISLKMERVKRVCQSETMTEESLKREAANSNTNKFEKNHSNVCGAKALEL